MSRYHTMFGFRTRSFFYLIDPFILTLGFLRRGCSDLFSRHILARFLVGDGRTSIVKRKLPFFCWLAPLPTDSNNLPLRPEPQEELLGDVQLSRKTTGRAVRHLLTE